MTNNFANQFIFMEFNNWIDYVVLLFLVVFVVQLIYYFGVFSRFAFYKKKELQSEELEPVSVVICAKNERDNLLNFLPEFLAQDYPIFEVIVVNDQ